MGRCPYDKLSHMEAALEEIRKLDMIKENKPGIFYLKGQGFLHFHEKDDKIWADVKDEDSWVPIDIPEKVTKKFLKEFVQKISDYHAAIVD